VAEKIFLLQQASERNENLFLFRPSEVVIRMVNTIRTLDSY
jgi:hypothetical protein